jgi:hypothetical protein
VFSPYSTYRHQTGLDCARFIIRKRLPLKCWCVHSRHVAGKINIEAELRTYCPEGEVFDPKIAVRANPK